MSDGDDGKLIIDESNADAADHNTAAWVSATQSSWRTNEAGRRFVLQFLQDELRSYVEGFVDSEAAERSLIEAQHEALGDALGQKLEAIKQIVRLEFDEHCARSIVEADQEKEYQTDISSSPILAGIESLRRVARQRRERERHDFDRRLGSVWSTFSLEHMCDREEISRVKVCLAESEARAEMWMACAFTHARRAVVADEMSHRMYTHWTESHDRTSNSLVAATATAAVATSSGGAVVMMSTASTPHQQQQQKPALWIDASVVECQGVVGYSTELSPAFLQRTALLTATLLALRAPKRNENNNNNNTTTLDGSVTFSPPRGGGNHYSGGSFSSCAATSPQPYLATPIFELRRVRNVDIVNTRETVHGRHFDFRVVLKDGTAHRFRCDSNDRRMVWVASIRKYASAASSTPVK